MKRGMFKVMLSYWWKFLVPVIVLLSFVLSKGSRPPHVTNKSPSQIFNIVDSQNFKKLIACVEVSSGTACFNRYGQLLVDEMKKHKIYPDAKDANK